MSTTFEVYPATADIPTFNQLLSAANGHLRARLRNIGIDAEAEISVALRLCMGDALIPFEADSQLRWNDKTYAWFAVPGVAGGTDAYFEQVNDLVIEVWQEYFKDDRLAAHEEKVRRCLKVGHYWTFRRSAGQPGMINLAYGVLAGTLAELTDGLVFSNDSAWVWSLLPTTGYDFLDRYLVPGGTCDDDAENWTEKCLDSIPGELGLGHGTD